MRFLGIVAVLLLSLLVVRPAVGQETRVYLDFDCDDDPYRIRTEFPEGEGVMGFVKVILEVGLDPLGGELIEWGFAEGCCTDSTGRVYFGTWGGIELYPEYLHPHILCRVWDISPPPCPGHQHGGNCTFRDDLDLEPCRRYFIGEGIWHCFSPGGCDPPTEFTYSFSVAEEYAGGGTMVFVPDVSATEAGTWGALKTLYR